MSEIEIRFQKERVDQFFRLLRMLYAKGDQIELDRAQSKRLLALSLFHTGAEMFLSYREGLRFLRTLDEQVISNMLFELADQIELNQLFERAHQHG